MDTTRVKNQENENMIYFTRHGESEANIEMVFSNRGLKHFLTDKGIQQAVKLAELLKNEDITYIYTSPVLRAIQTATIIANKLEILLFEVHEYLREYDVGDLEDKFDSKSWKLFFANEKDWQHEKNRNNKLNNGESFNEIQSRFQSFIHTIMNNEHLKDKNILVISHGGLLKIGAPKVMVNVDYTFTIANPLKNCDLIKCCHEDGNLICQQWGGLMLR